jgi:CRISPR-associated protein Cas2
MLMMLMEAVPPRLRGELTRWLTPLSSRVYIGRVTPVVRDLLWDKARRESPTGRLMQAWSAPQSERGFEFRMQGFDGISKVELEGVPFTCVRDAAWIEANERFRLTQGHGGP